MKFVKMHGCGNDYVYLDGLTDASVAARIDRPGWVNLVRRMSDRHKGIGSDGVIVLCPPTKSAKRGTGGSPSGPAGEAAQRAHVRMRMFNADGSESEMCGNGIRCVAKFAHDRLGVRGGFVNVQTGNGIMPIEVHTRRGRVHGATVDMGQPREGLKSCHVIESKLSFKGENGHWGVEADDLCLCGVFISMGNPHFVVFEPLDDSRDRTMTPKQVAAAELERFGPAFEHHPAFAKRMNIHLAGNPKPRRDRADRIVMRTWERGSGITQACGTGACAVAVAGVLTGRSQRDVDIDLPGGRLRIEWDARTNHVFMTGEAVDICEGVWLGAS